MTHTQNTIEKRGLFAWLMQRVSGVFLAYALVIHLWTVNVVNQGELNWQTISSRLQDGNFWFIYYILFIPAVIYHAFNGLWSIVLDYNPSPAKQRLLVWLFWTGGIGLTIYGYIGLKPLFGLTL